MTVRELMQKLATFDPDLDVRFSDDEDVRRVVLVTLVSGVEVVVLTDTDEDIDERISAIEKGLNEKVAAYMALHLPDVYYEFDVFDSDNGDDDWEAPLACSLVIEELGVEDAYGLCDAGVGTVEEQVQYLFEQVVEELQAELKVAARRAGTEPIRLPPVNRPMGLDRFSE